MNAHVLQHVAFEGPGSIHEWLDARGAQTSYTRFFENGRLPALDKVDLLIAMGGPMSVNDEAELPLAPIREYWHGETFDLPDGAVRLVKSVARENRAFQLKRNVMGLQFHLETTPESALAIVENCRDELIPGPYVQSEQELRAIPDSIYKAVNGLMSDVLTHLTRAAG